MQRSKVKTQIILACWPLCTPRVGSLSKKRQCNNRNGAFLIDKYTTNQKGVVNG